MIFHDTTLEGTFTVEPEPRHDDRGFLARVFCAEEFSARGLSPAVAQANLSWNHRKGTLRGLHYQVPPATEEKLIWCITGSLYDVVVDMRPDSSTYLSHYGVELSSENRRGMYIPAMCAHGCQALADDTEILYLISGAYSPKHERGLRYSDPALNIAWPLPVTQISVKDAAWPMLNGLLHSRGGAAP